MMGTCTGRGQAGGGHCCWVKGEVCEFLIENHEDRRYACSLRVELGDWDKVHADPRYAPIKEVMLLGDGLCGDWQPQAGVCCNEAR
jgi:hypothetical protein